MLRLTLISQDHIQSEGGRLWEEGFMSTGFGVDLGAPDWQSKSSDGIIRCKGGGHSYTGQHWQEENLVRDGVNRPPPPAQSQSQQFKNGGGREKKEKNWQEGIFGCVNVLGDFHSTFQFAPSPARCIYTVCLCVLYVDVVDVSLSLSVGVCVCVCVDNKERRFVLAVSL